MAEKTLNNPLSGEEVIEAILDKVRGKLETDCYLNPNSAYDWFSAEIEIHLDMHDAGSHVKGDYKTQVSHGGKAVEMAQHVEAEFHIDPAPPNEVRVETGQPVPTLTKDAQGKDVVEGVRYGRKDAKKAMARAAAKAVVLLLFLGGGLYGQKADPPKPDPPAALNPTESIALRSLVEQNRRIQQEQQQALADLRAIEADIVKNHPGYHLDENTLQLARDDVKKAAK